MYLKCILSLYKMYFLITLWMVALFNSSYSFCKYDFLVIVPESLSAAVSADLHNPLWEDLVAHNLISIFSLWLGLFFFAIDTTQQSTNVCWVSKGFMYIYLLLFLLKVIPVFSLVSWHVGFIIWTQCVFLVGNTIMHYNKPYWYWNAVYN